jgi:DtxR family transcriptional regulator, Mn-dependent transcriptional regulator
MDRMVALFEVAALALSTAPPHSMIDIGFGPLWRAKTDVDHRVVFEWLDRAAVSMIDIGYGPLWRAETDVDHGKGGAGRVFRRVWWSEAESSAYRIFVIAAQKTHSPSIEDYVKTVYKLTERGGPTVTTTALAGALDVAPSSASGMVRKLADTGLVQHARYGDVELTAAGRRLALDVLRRHRLIELYLVSALGYSWDEVHDEAEQLEHVVSDKLLDRIAERLGDPEYDPHGDPIPARDGTIRVPESVLLSELTPGATGRFVRVDDTDPDLLRHLQAIGIGLGEQITVLNKEPFGGPLEVRAGAKKHSLAPGLTEAMSIELDA